MRFNRPIHLSSLVWPLLFLFLVNAGFAFSQEQLDFNFGNQFQTGASAPKATVSAKFEIEQGTRRGRITVTAVIAEGWHSNSLVQKKGEGPGPLLISLEESAQFTLAGEFVADSVPVRTTYPDAWPGVDVYEHSGTVHWTAPIQIVDDVDIESLEIPVKFNAIVCSDTCIPFREKPEAKFAGYYVPAVTNSLPPVEGATESKQSSDETGYELDQFVSGHGQMTGRVMNQKVTPGETLQVVFSLNTSDGYHAYRYHDELPDPLDYSPTLMRIQPGGIAGNWTITPSIATESKMLGGLNTVYYPGPVEFTLEIPVRPDVAPGIYRITGTVGFQTCVDGMCDPPEGSLFLIPVQVVRDATTEEPDTKPASIKFALGDYRDITNTYTDWSVPKLIEVSETSASTGISGQQLDLGNLTVESSNADANRSLLAVLLFALLGGFILNFMPCVLPVIGLKVMSFMEQAGQDRWQALKLNIWYTAGILSVFMVLASMAAFFSFGWGQQSQSAAFQITLAAVVFVMGLSFLGVWEIPIPGFVGSGKAAKASGKEGVAGAFLKGILTTILAVPCSGPGISVALTWCVGKPPYLIYLVFLFLGLGMAIPYIVLGFNPGLVRMLPRPGAWMETFKQFMGFVLLATVVWLLWTIPIQLMLPSFAFLFVLWFACWWIGKIPYTASRVRSVRGWLSAAAIGVIGALVAFQYLAPATEGKVAREFQRRVAELQRSGQSWLDVEAVAADIQDESSELPWEFFTIERLMAETALQKTVVVDFTADWCMTCKFLERTVLNTQKVREVVEASGLVMLMADWTDRNNPDIDFLLEQFKAREIPLLAIFPARRPNKPIVLKGGYTQGMLLDKLKEAGPSIVPNEPPVSSAQSSTAGHNDSTPAAASRIR